MSSSSAGYDAILLVSFGGPEGPDEVMPFLENVLRGRNVPRERMLEVSEHYLKRGGVSPINAQCRSLLDAMKAEFREHGIELPVYWGNRNWKPMLADTVAEMKEDGIQRALAFVLSSTSSYSSCRQYREDIERARGEAGDGAPEIDKLRVFYNHPDFIGASVKSVAGAIERVPEARREQLRIAFTAHSIPKSMSETSDYVEQLTEASQLIADRVGVDAGRWSLVYQSRSGPPQVPWLEPDIVDHLRNLHGNGARDVVVMPVGFLSDHMEVVHDLDDEAASACEELGLNMVRASTVGVDPQFLGMIRKLVLERLSGATRESLGRFGPGPDVCAVDCCPAPVRR
ncbi:MAG: ferrochelatase [Candidatus Binatia bacterium]|nr:ferrochelatase [Candidatus Binatia bacterium]